MNHRWWLQRNRKVGSSLNTAATIEALMLGIVLGTVPWSKLPRFRMKGWMPKGGGHVLDKITWLLQFLTYYKTEWLIPQE